MRVNFISDFCTVLNRISNGIYLEEKKKPNDTKKIEKKNKNKNKNAKSKKEKTKSELRTKTDKFHECLS